MPMSPRGFSTAPSRMPVANRPAPPTRVAPTPMATPRSAPARSSMNADFGRDPMAFNRKALGYKSGGSNKKSNSKW